MGDLSWLLYVVIGVVVAAIVIIIILVLRHNNRQIDIENISINDNWVRKNLHGLALTIVGNDYNAAGRPTHTQKGEARVDFTKDVARFENDIYQLCFQGEKASVDLCNFAKANYPVLKANNLNNVVFNYMNYRKDVIKNNYNSFLSSFNSITPAEFFELKNMQTGDSVGVYVIHNETKNMYYVGQAKRLFFRINQHFTGHGNGDVYADYKYGNDFSIQIIKLSDSGYSDLDRLEKDLIEKYDAYNSGYNKTAGNR